MTASLKLLQNDYSGLCVLTQQNLNHKSPEYGSEDEHNGGGIARIAGDLSEAGTSLAGQHCLSGEDVFVVSILLSLLCQPKFRCGHQIGRNYSMARGGLYGACHFNSTAPQI
ncbi:hypothetical protein AOLI_G00126140 [Acnodon oligacanthus]